ncbi:hypothetical protein MTO96_002979 [Rhipicephalus appendiculatus]
MATRSAKRWDSKEGEAFLFVAILSSHKTEHLRNAARRTWLKLAPASERRVVYKFFVAAKGVPPKWVEKLHREQRQFNDVVIIYEAADTYEMLTSKLVYSLQWVVKHYYFDFLLKLDDDSFARVDAIADELAQWKQDSPGRELYWGYFAGNAPVFTSGKWAERTWYLRDGYYLPYARGGGIRSIPGCRETHRNHGRHHLRTVLQRRRVCWRLDCTAEAGTQARPSFRHGVPLARLLQLVPRHSQADCIHDVRDVPKPRARPQTLPEGNEVETLVRVQLERTTFAVLRTQYDGCDLEASQDVPLEEQSVMPDVLGLSVSCPYSLEL